MLLLVVTATANEQTRNGQLMTCVEWLGETTVSDSVSVVQFFLPGLKQATLRIAQFHVQPRPRERNTFVPSSSSFMPNKARYCSDPSVSAWRDAVDRLFPATKF
jgi:hypothetical protein